MMYTTLSEMRENGVDDDLVSLVETTINMFMRDGPINLAHVFSAIGVYRVTPLLHMLSKDMGDDVHKIMVSAMLKPNRDWADDELIALCELVKGCSDIETAHSKVMGFCKQRLDSPDQSLKESHVELGLALADSCVRPMTRDSIRRALRGSVKAKLLATLTGDELSLRSNGYVGNLNNELMTHDTFEKQRDVFMGWFINADRPAPSDDKHPVNRGRN